MTRGLEALAALAARRPRLVIVAVVLSALMGAAGALTLEPDASNDTFVDRDAPTAQATTDLAERFGTDAVIILLRGDLRRTVLGDNLPRLAGLEGCLAGTLPAGVPPVGGPQSPCGWLAARKPAQVVIGPGTFVNQSAREITTVLRRRLGAAREKAQRAALAARELARRQGLSAAQGKRLAEQAQQLAQRQSLVELLRLQARYGLTGLPRLDDPTFVAQIVFDGTKPAGTPKARFAYLFPSPQAALIQVRLRPALTIDERREAISQIRAVLTRPEFALDRVTPVVTGAPVVVDDLAQAMGRELVGLLGAAVVVMALVLLVLFSGRPRLLALGVALAAVAITFGLLALSGRPLTIAAIAALPVLVGLVVDYAIQLQVRIADVHARERLPAAASAQRAASVGGRTVATAALATAAGFAVLGFSPVPMVRDFGALLIVGTLVGLLVAVLITSAVFVLWAGRAEGIPPASEGDRTSRARRLTRSFARIRAAGLAPIGRLVAASRALAIRQPARVVGVVAVLAVAGWALEHSVTVESDVVRLVPSGEPSVQSLKDLQSESGVVGQVDVLVRADNVADPEVIAWLQTVQRRVLDEVGYSDAAGCVDTSLCPALSLPDLFGGRSGQRSSRQITALLDTIPTYFSQNVISPDRTSATLSFGVALGSLEAQRTAIDALTRAADDPPAGVTAQVAGLPAIAVDANAEIGDSTARLLSVLGGLLLVALVLAGLLRSLAWTAVILVPIVLAIGVASLVLVGVGVALNPLSVMLGTLVVAIGTEFSVLLAERYRFERRGGAGVSDALAQTYAATGRAVAVSGVTATAGFAVLISSDYPMIRSFGLVCVLYLTVALAAVFFVLPAVIVQAQRWSDRRAAGETSP